MPTVTVSPFGAYTAPTEVISAAAQTEVIAEIAKLSALIADPYDAYGAGVHSAGSPDFDHMHPENAHKLQLELKALKTAIDAAPTA